MSALDDILGSLDPGNEQAIIAALQADLSNIPLTAPPVDPTEFDLSQYPDVGQDTSSPLETAKCCSDKICGCLGGAIRSIAYSQAKIAASIDDFLNKPCRNIEQCMDKIIDALRKKFERPLATADECKKMISDGLGGTFEYVFACAGVTASQCDTACSLGDTSTEGKCCSSCGQPEGKCHCVGGICTPDEEKEQKRKRYRGWCDQVGNIVTVLPEDSPQPGPTYVPVTLADTEEVALQEATQYCRQNTQQQNPPPFIAQASSPGTICSVADYLSGAAGDRFGQALPGLFSTAGLAQALNAVGHIGIDGISVNNIAQTLTGIFQDIVANPPLAADAMIPRIVTALGCTTNAAVQALEALVSLGIIEQYTGAGVTQFAHQYRYTVNAGCRQVQLSPDQATAAYLARQIERPTLEAHWAIAGYCPDAIEWNLQASRSKPVPLQLAVMRHREIISSSEYSLGMRQIGYLENDVSEKLFQATYQVPTMSDIIRFMVRDADDEGLVARFGLDSFFSEKYRSQLKKWSKDQGIPDTVAQYAWRAHWQIPAPGQLFEFWHRRRTSNRPGGAPKLLEDIKAALIQQDILPYWHDDYLAVSYRPLTRIDVRRAFNIGSLTEQEVTDAYIQLGYSDDTAAKLTKFSVRLRDQSIPSHRAVKLWLDFTIDKGQARDRMVADGLPAAAVDTALADTEAKFKTSVPAQSFLKGAITKQRFIELLVANGVSAAGAEKIAAQLALKITSHPVVKEYIVGAVSRNDAQKEMVNYGMDDGVAEHLLNESDRAVSAQQVLNCQRGIKRKYLMGELNKAESITALQSTGTSNERAPSMVNGWDCERSSQGKAVAANKLCEWLSRGAISSVEFTSRLINIGYHEDVAGLMLDDCLISINARRLANAKRDAKEQAAQSLRAAKALRQAQAAENRQVALLAAAGKRAADLRINREKQLYSAIGKVHKACDCPLGDVVVFVKDAKIRVGRDYGLDVDQTLQVLIRASEEWGGGDMSTLTPVINTIAQSIVGEFADQQQ